MSKYLELPPTGKGLCPFHDAHRASLSVNIEENYWHCFAGCTGGDGGFGVIGSLGIRG